MLTVLTTSVFRRWLDRLKDDIAVRAIAARINRLKSGNAGDAKGLGDGLIEIRLRIGPGYRIYYALRGEQIVLLLCGGDKSTQNRDIDQARHLLGVYDRGELP